MGEVFEAWDTLLNRRVALKLLNHWSASAIPRMVQEARLQARAEHPNICRVLDCDAEADLPYIAMELVEGPTLRRVELSPAEVFPILRQVADALHFAHRHRLIHRDLKPGNILLESRPDGHWRPVLCDFGLAKSMDGESLALTRTGLGTPGFMSPEQIGMVDSPIGPPADIYSLGATLLDCLRIWSPHPSEELTTPAAREIFLNREIGKALLDPKLLAILRRAMAWHPEDRYPSAAAFGEDLRRFEEGEPLGPTPWTPWLPLFRWAHRNPRISAGIAGLIVVAASAFFMAIRARAQAQQQSFAAVKFIEIVKDLEFRMRVERMLPVHDLRPAFRQVRSTMERLQGEMRQRGPTSHGPGNFALGCGHLMLREPQESIQAFHRAIALGYATDSLWASLAQAHCEAYSTSLPQSRLKGEAGLQALQKLHLDPAMEAITRISPASGSLRARALLHFHAIGPEPIQAVQLLESLGLDSTGSYEHQLWAGEACERLGHQAQASGNPGEAAQWYARADQAIQRAREVGRSDEWVLKVQLNRQLSWIPAQMAAGKLGDGSFREVDQLTGQLQVINPDWLPGLSDSATVLWRKAFWLFETKREAGPTLAAANALLDRAAHLPGGAAALRRDRLMVALAQGWVEFERGVDPTHNIETALRNESLDELTAELDLLAARVSIDQSGDPAPFIVRALEGLKSPSFDPPGSYGVLQTQGRAHILRAQSAFYRASDPTTALHEAELFNRLALISNPTDPDSWLNQARIHEVRARWLRKRGGNPNQEWERARASNQRALDLAPRLPIALRNHANILAQMAMPSLGSGDVNASKVQNARTAFTRAKRAARRSPYLAVVDLRISLLQIHLLRAEGADWTEQALSMKSNLELAKRRKVAVPELRLLEEELRSMKVGSLPRLG